MDVSGYSCCFWFLHFWFLATRSDCLQQMPLGITRSTWSSWTASWQSLPRWFMGTPSMKVILSFLPDSRFYWLVTSNISNIVIVLHLIWTFRYIIYALHFRNFLQAMVVMNLFEMILVDLQASVHGQVVYPMMTSPCGPTWDDSRSPKGFSGPRSFGATYCTWKMFVMSPYLKVWPSRFCCPNSPRYHLVPLWLRDQNPNVFVLQKSSSRCHRFQFLAIGF